MNTRTLLHTERTSAARRGGLLLALAAAALLMSLPAFADDQGRNQLQSINAQKLAGDRVQLTFQLSGAAPQPLAFTVNQPARISLDLADTRLAIKQRKTDVQAGMVNSVVAAEAGGRTRVVINLTTLVPYATHSEGNTLYVIVGSNTGDTAVTQTPVSSFGPQVTGTAAAAPMVAAAAPSPAPAAAPAPAPSQTAAPTTPAGSSQIASVDFRRGPDGAGQVMVTLPDPSEIGRAHV